MERTLEQTLLEQRETLSQMKQTMEHAAAEHAVSLHDMKKVVRDSSLEKLAVQKERTERQMEVKKVSYTFG
jgi:hypothetical protein